MLSTEQMPVPWLALAGCEGYRVDTGDGRLGFVEEVRPARTEGLHGTLAVRAGAAGTRLLILPAEEVESVNASRRVVVVRSSPRLCGTEPVSTARHGFPPLGMMETA